MAEQVIDNAVASGAVRDHGAHVTAWAPAGHSAVVWVSAHAVYAEGVAIRGGVPICFPWFGPGRSGNLSPAHGFARVVEWRLVDVIEDADAVTVVHELDEQLATSVEFPYAYRATSTARFADTLTLTLEVQNTDDVAFSYEAALHTYLRVGDSEAISVAGLEGDSYLDQVEGARAVQRGPIRLVGEVDRVYASVGAVHVVDPSLGRTISIAKSGSGSTVVWNPWVSKARRLPDFGDQEWREMVCVETANIGDAAVHLAPGQSHRMQAIISVS